MPRPEPHTISFTLDGRDVQAPANTMLADAAKLGGVEIPVFCYEPKLGQPVGACRMCLVEIEGIPKLQTACSTPVKDGMVVNTETDRVKEAQRAIVEFLLINHPLDCPVCDKGGECPLQDITFGWGAGNSRFIEPKRHFEKPLALSPLIAIDRERCILCYRCVRFSQEISEDYQLILLERGAHSFVGTFDGHPYVAPFSGNIIELCPVGALTSRPYRFRARPWEIEGAGSLCTLCPSQCNVTYTVRDDRVLRVLARDHEDVDDGWLCDKGRFAYQAMHADARITGPLLRESGELRAVSWERALEAAATGLAGAGRRAGALAGAGASNEDGLLLSRLLRDALGSPDIDSTTTGPPSLATLRSLADPARQASVQDLEWAHGVLVLDCEPIDEVPILELRIRKGVRRNAVKLAVATSRPSALDSVASAAARFAPGRGREFAAALAAALSGGDGASELGALASAAGASVEGVRAVAGALGGEEIVVLYGERAACDALGALGGSKLLAVPEHANGRGLREVGVLPNAGPGLSAPVEPGRSAPQIARALMDGELVAMYLLGVDPGPEWDAPLERASTVIAHAAFLTDRIREHATVVFPSEAAAEKEGTVTHPDGRLQRLRPAVGRPGEVRAEWQVLAELAARLGHDTGLLTGAMATRETLAAVPLYADIDLEQIGGRGVRWPERPGAADRLAVTEGGPPPAPAGAAALATEPMPAVEPMPAAEPAAAAAPAPPPAPALGATPGSDGRLLLGSFRSVWDAPEVEHSPALKFLSPRGHVELSPQDARRLGVRHGEAVLLTGESIHLRATASLRDAVPEGSAFVESGLAGALAGVHVQVHRVAGAAEPVPA
ncbi:MAG: NADH-quinone oxidoreductase subunit NuoG [Solirubrobacteraceae bacterium]